MRDLNGGVAIVTGAASGIGRAMALAFAREGMRVVLADIEAESLKNAQREVDALSVDTHTVVVDVSDRESVDRLAASTYEVFGAAHVLCNNAGVGGDFRPVWEQSAEGFQWVMGVNLWGVLHGLQAFVPRMLEAGEPGHIVNTASIAGMMSMPLGGAYHASKQGVVALSESLVFELREQKAAIGVSLLCPGYVATQIGSGDRNRPEALRESTPLSAREQRWRDAISKTLANAGSPPSQVAACVVDAIRDDRFYVFSHPEWLESIETRFGNILSGKAPSWRIPEAALRPTAG